jgi:predicted alpha/beta superfamily hydrolase
MYPEMQPAPFTLPHAESFELTSSAGERFRISVGFPFSYTPSGRSYPVLYVLDANMVFCTALEISRYRGTFGDVGEVVVVGIGYPETDLPTWVERRTHDFTSAEWDTSRPIRDELVRIYAQIGREIRLGGVEPLLELITGQLQPLVAARYHVDADDQALFGHSAGGNLVAQAIFRRPGAFRKLIAASPAFYLNDWEVFRLEADHAARHGDLPVRLYLGIGSDETADLANLGIASGTTRFAETLQLRRYPSLELSCELFRGNHLSTLTQVLHRGLEVCWPGRPVGMNTDTMGEVFG